MVSYTWFTLLVNYSIMSHTSLDHVTYILYLITSVVQDICIYIHVHMYIYTYTYVYIYAYMYIYVYIYIFIYTHEYMYIHTYLLNTHININIQNLLALFCLCMCDVTRFCTDEYCNPPPLSMIDSCICDMTHSYVWHMCVLEEPFDILRIYI